MTKTSYLNKNFWIKKLEGKLEKTIYPYDYSEGLGKDRIYQSFSFDIPSHISKQIIKISNNSSSRVYIALLTSVLILLRKVIDRDDLFIGIPVFKSNMNKEFSNHYYPFLTTLGNNISVKEVLQNTRKRLIEVDNHSVVSIDNIVDELNLKADNDNNQLFDISILFENIQEKYHIDHEKHNLQFSFSESNEEIKLQIDYNSKLYSNQTIQLIKERLLVIFNQIFNDFNLKLQDISILGKYEEKIIREEFHNNIREFPEDLSLIDYVKENVKERPDSIAIQQEDQFITYGSIDVLSDNLAKHLIDNYNLKSAEIIGVLMQRDISMLVSILSIWKIGGVYLPIDPSAPIDRIQTILKDSNCACILTNKNSYEGQINDQQYIIYDVSQGQRSSVSHPQNIVDLRSIRKNKDDIAYIIYTSGSTGTPKGAIVNHIGMMNHIYAKINDLSLNKETIIAQNASHTFDISIWQFLTSIILGSKTIIYSNELILNPLKFINELQDHQINTLEVVPSYLDILIDFAAENKYDFSPLKYVIVTGEELKSTLVKKWFSKYNNTLVNAYGPTEASDDITHAFIGKDDNNDSITIGKPVQNFNIYIINDKGEQQAINQKGEICVAGIGVGLGYLNNPEKTNNSFIPNPFNKSSVLYKTGDIGSWMTNGEINFYGRKDYQVKIRGYRIELGEIENAILAYGNIGNCVVVVDDVDNVHKEICAFFISSGNVDESILKSYLAKKLPSYMIPDRFLRQEKFPFSTNGKIDRNALKSLLDRSVIDYISHSRLKNLENKLLGAKILNNTELVGKGDRSSQSYIINEDEIQLSYDKPVNTSRKYYSLSEAQKGIYYADKKYGGTTTIEVLKVIYNEVIQIKLLEKAINHTIFKNVGLRLRVIDAKKHNEIIPVQFVSEYMECKFDYFDFSDEGGNDKLEDWISDNALIPFVYGDNDLFYFALFKRSEKEYGFYVKIHHLIHDGFTFKLIFDEIINSYKNLLSGKELDQTKNTSYITYLGDEIEYLSSEKSVEDKNFLLSKILPLPKQETTLCQSESISDSKDGNVKFFYLPENLKKKISEYCFTQMTTPYRLVMSAISIYVYLVKGVEDIVIGGVGLNRNMRKFADTSGMFVNFRQFRIKVKSIEFEKFEKFVSKIVTQTIKHEQYPYSLLNQGIKQVLGFDIDNVSDIHLNSSPPMNTSEYYVERSFGKGSYAEPLCITVHGQTDITQLPELEYRYHINMFTEDEITQINHSIFKILNDVTTNPQLNISDIELVSEDLKNKFIECLKQQPLVNDHDLNSKLGIDKTDKHYVLSPKLKLLPSGVVGHLYSIHQKNVFEKYEQNNYFIKKAKLSSYNKEEYILDTNKLAKYRPDGSIEIIKEYRDSISISNKEIQYQEIEKIFLDVPEIEAVNLHFNKIRSEKIFVLYSSQKRFTKKEFEDILKQKGYSSNDFCFIQFEKFPDYRNNFELFEQILISDKSLSKNLKKPSSNSQIENKLIKIFSKLLKIEESSVEKETNFFTSGGNSLRATFLIANINKEFNCNLQIDNIFRYPAIQELAARIEKEIEIIHKSIRKVEKKEYYKATSVQTRLYILQQMDTESMAYNISQAVEIEGEIDIQKFKRVFDSIVKRHSSLRTSFFMKGNVCYQKIHDSANYDFKYYSNNETIDDVVKEIKRPFDLNKDPLFRIAILKREGKDNYLLIMHTHHIISDGTSLNILNSEICELYNDKNLPENKLQYVDFSYWNNKFIKSKEFFKQEDFWLNEFNDEFTRLELPLDFKRPMVSDYSGDVVFGEIDKNLTEKLKLIIEENNVTLYMLLMACFNIFLSKICNQERIIVGTGIAGRRHADISNMLGMFVNTLVIKNDVKGNMSFIKFLDEVKEKVINAFINQDYPYENLVEKVKKGDNASHNSLFDVLFILQNIETDEYAIDNIKFKSYQLNISNSKFDFMLDAIENNDRIVLKLNYSTELFERSTVQKFMQYFHNVINAITKNPAVKILEIDILNESDRSKIINDFSKNMIDSH